MRLNVLIAKIIKRIFKNCRVKLEIILEQIGYQYQTHQQLKLYQDGLEQKIEQHKKQKKQMDKKYESVKKKYQQLKLSITNNTEKCLKIQQENQRLRNQIRQIKQQQPTVRVQEPKRPLTRYQSNKQNLSQWRNNNFNERQRQRSSLEKRPESTERMRVSVNVRSTKGIPISSKIVQQKAKQQKAKALKNRLGF